MPPLDKAHQLERRARTIVESLQGTWGRGKGMCCCPAHDDRTPSLSVTLGRKAILFHCFAGCSNEEVIGVAANWLDGDLAADAPNRKWAGDITYVWTSEGWLYLAVILDLHSRRVVGWAVSDRMKKDLAIRALDMAVRLRQPPEDCIFHSDRGSQYCSYDYQKKLQAYGLRPSMSGKGNCYDNSAVETFFKSLKAEMIWRQSWPTRRQAEAAIFQYINGFYNSRRRHSYLGGISPLAFEAKVA